MEQGSELPVATNVQALMDYYKQNRKILLIDDDTNLYETINQYKDFFLAEWMPAYSGEDGLILLESFKPDKVVLDIKLPLMQGDEVFKRIRSFDKYVPIIFLAGEPDPVSIRVIRSLGRLTTVCFKPPVFDSMFIRDLNEILGVIRK